MQEFLIFKTGSYPQGNYPREGIETFVNAFNASKDQISIVIGHRPWVQTDDDELSHGWINLLRIDGAGKVFAVNYELDDTVRSLIATKKLKKCSVEIWGNGTEQDPYKISALALLGRTAPQIAQTFLPSIFGIKSHDGAVYLPAEDLDRECFSATAPAVATKPEEDMPMTDEEKKEFTTLKTTVSGIETSVGQLTESLKAFTSQGPASSADAKKKNAEAFFGALRDEGKITPAQFETAVSIDVSLDDTGRAGYRSLFATAKPVVSLDGSHEASRSDAPDDTPVDEAQTVADIKVFQAANSIKTFSEAAKLYYDQKKVGKKGGQK